jgi:predicted nucleic acid-binding protein
MASLLGQFFTSIKGSQEDIASKSLAYIFEKSYSAKNVINDIIKNKTNLTFENIKYITQSIGKNKERPTYQVSMHMGKKK